jgi:hypothetical protein
MTEDLRTTAHRTLVKNTSLPICHGVTGPCFNIGKRRRQNTAYADDKRNWVFLCDECAEINYEYWQNQWNEYYNAVM